MNEIINEIIRILNDFHLKKENISDRKPKKIEIENIEVKYNVKLLEEYKEMLSYYKTLFFEQDIKYKPKEISPFTCTDGTQMFNGFFGIREKRNLDSQIETYLGRMPKYLVPIGESPGGNLICMGISDSYLGKIYFWNHEDELKAKIMAGMIKREEYSKYKIDSYWDNLYLIAESLLEFIKKLEIIEEIEEVNTEEVEMWLADDLLNEK